MRSISRRSISAFAPALIVAAAMALDPAAAAAASHRVSMDTGYSYSPNSITVPLGDSVKWTNTSSVTKHDVNASRPYKLFSSGGAAGMHQNQSYQFVFTSAGSFSYVCLAHSSDNMKGTVTVPMKVRRISGSPERFKITLGSAAIPSSAPWQRVVQVDLPGGGTSYAVVKTTRAATFKYTPRVHGTYRFRSYVKSTGSAGQSGTSPVVAISH